MALSRWCYEGSYKLKLNFLLAGLISWWYVARFLHSIMKIMQFSCRGQTIDLQFCNFFSKACLTFQFLKLHWLICVKINFSFLMNSLLDYQNLCYQIIDSLILHFEILDSQILDTVFLLIEALFYFLIKVAALDSKKNLKTLL